MKTFKISLIALCLLISVTLTNEIIIQHLKGIYLIGSIFLVSMPLLLALTVLITLKNK